MKFLFIIALLLDVGCANVATTRFVYSVPNGGTFLVEVPKEVQAKDFSVALDASTGKATVTASSIITQNQGSILAQGQREQSNLNQLGTLTQKVSEGVTSGAVSGAMKGVVP